MAVCYTCKNVSRRGREDGQQHGGSHLIRSLLPHLAPIPSGNGGKGCRRVRREGHDGRWASGGTGDGTGEGRTVERASEARRPGDRRGNHVITAPGTGITIDRVSRPRLDSTFPPTQTIGKARRISNGLTSGQTQCG
jgi:hypothetical protein